MHIETPGTWCRLLQTAEKACFCWDAAAMQCWDAAAMQERALLTFTSELLENCNNGYSDMSWTFLTLKMISRACFNIFRYFKNVCYINFDCLLYKIKFWKLSKPWENSFLPGEAVWRVHCQSSHRCHSREKQICLIFFLVLGIIFQLCVWLSSPCSVVCSRRWSSF